MEKHHTDMTFDELIDLHTRQIHMSLLGGGSKEMHSAVALAMMQTLQWHTKREQEKIKARAAEANTKDLSAAPKPGDLVVLPEIATVRAGDIARDQQGYPHVIPSTHPAVGQSVAAVCKMRKFCWTVIQRPVAVAYSLNNT